METPVIPMRFVSEDFVPGIRFEGKSWIWTGNPPENIDTIDPDYNPRIVQTGQTWGLWVYWKQWGPMCELIDKQCDWVLQVYMEKMGQGEYPDAPAVTKSFVQQDNYPNWKSIPMPGVNQPGLYKISLAVTFRDPDGDPCPMAAFAEGPLVQFYKPS